MTSSFLFLLVDVSDGNSVFEVVETFFEELDETVFVEVVGTRLMKELAIVTHEAVIRLGVGAELRDLEVGIFAAYSLFHLAITTNNPFFLRKFGLVVDVKCHDNEIVA